MTTDVTIGQLEPLTNLADSQILEIAVETVDNYKVTVLQLKQFITRVIDLATIDSVDSTNDQLLLWDNSASSTRKISPKDLTTAIIVSNPTTTLDPVSQLNFSPIFSLDSLVNGMTTIEINITAVSEELSPSGVDLLVLYDSSSMSNKKLTLNSLTTLVTNNLAIDQLIEETDYSPDNDYIPFLDNSSSSVRKVNGRNIIPGNFVKSKNFTLTTLIDAANIAWDLNANQVTQVVLGGNRTLSSPTNQQAGATYILLVKQDTTGSRTLTFHSVYQFPNGTTPTLSSDPETVDIFSFISDGVTMYSVGTFKFTEYNPSP